MEKFAENDAMPFDLTAITLKRTTFVSVNGENDAKMTAFLLKLNVNFILKIIIWILEMMLAIVTAKDFMTWLVAEGIVLFEKLISFSYL